MAVSAENSKGAKKDLFGFVLLFLILLNLAAIGGIAHYMQQLSQRIIQLNKKVEIVSEQASQNQTSLGEQLEPTKLGRLHPLDGFLVNLSGESGPRFLQTQIELELEDEAVLDEIVRNKAAIRDRVISVLGSQKYDRLREPAGLESLRENLKRSLNSILSTGKIREVYFTQFHFN